MSSTGNHGSQIVRPAPATAPGAGPVAPSTPAWGEDLDWCLGARLLTTTVPETGARLFFDLIRPCDSDAPEILTEIADAFTSYWHSRGRRPELLETFAWKAAGAPRRERARVAAAMTEVIEEAMAGHRRPRDYLTARDTVSAHAHRLGVSVPVEALTGLIAVGWRRSRTFDPSLAFDMKRILDREMAAADYPAATTVLAGLVDCDHDLPERVALGLRRLASEDGGLAPALSRAIRNLAQRAHPSAVPPLPRSLSEFDGWGLIAVLALLSAPVPATEDTHG